MQEGEKPEHLCTYLAFDTETTGLAGNENTRLIEIAWVKGTFSSRNAETWQYLIKPKGMLVPEKITDLTGITDEMLCTSGIPVRDALAAFSDAVRSSDCVIAHNMSFDKTIIADECSLLGIQDPLSSATLLCTMKAGVAYGKKNTNRPSKKTISLINLHKAIFGIAPPTSHRALPDAISCARCAWILAKSDTFQENAAFCR
ncbi:3'-5' exonuclease [Methanogenium sp. S4BF]|uniref:3'-5' exonuclease n=1 Tax=Methanogenium sp. S4BF TaxID=1789226 RepID=UPI002416FA4B|nr:3'-5' exonuclease [Methanogenium sp. S4BF]WFN33431.1 3'-5' exonuclease [Methanogenium sp. S4BF]